MKSQDVVHFVVRIIVQQICNKWNYSGFRA